MRSKWFEDCCDKQSHVTQRLIGFVHLLQTKSLNLNFEFYLLYCHSTFEHMGYLMQEVLCFILFNVF